MVSILMRLITCGAGACLIWLVFDTVKRRKMSEINSVFWLLAGALMILLGMFPWLIVDMANLLRLEWAPAVVFFFAILVIAFMLFNMSKQLSILESKTAELAMQVTLLKTQLAQKEQQAAENAEKQGIVHTGQDASA